VEKQRRLANNLQLQKAATPAKPVEVGAVWTTPDDSNPNGQKARLHTGRFFVNPGKGSDPNIPSPLPTAAQLGLALPTRRINQP